MDIFTAFEVGRGHKMERSNYIQKLMNLVVKDGPNLKIPKLPALAIDTETDKGTQTNRGFWIDEQMIPNKSRLSTHAPTDAANQIEKQVQLIGCVSVQRSDLIPDGRGGYFVHINSKDIQRKESNTPPNRGNHSGNFNKRSSHQNSPHTKRFQPQPKGPYMQRPRYQGDSMPPYGNAYVAVDNFRMQTRRGPRYDESLPFGNNNLVEDLLRMQNRPRGGPPSRSNQPF